MLAFPERRFAKLCAVLGTLLNYWNNFDQPLWSGPGAPGRERSPPLFVYIRVHSWFVIP